MTVFRESFQVGVVVERRRIENPWQEFAWRPVAVLPESSPPSTSEVPHAPATWRVLRETADLLQAHAGSTVLELFRRETQSYLYNLATGDPKLYVAIRRTDDPGRPWRPLLVTAAPDEAQAVMEGGDDIVDGVPMPPEIQAWLEAFTAEHHVDEPFYKRTRDPARRSGGKPR